MNKYFTSWFPTEKQGANHWWVAGSDRGDESNFKWCYPDRVDDFREPPFVPFQTGEPDNKDGVENCLEIERKDSSTFFNDVYCNLNRSYICEVNLT